jgi:hypothetical protein
MVARERRLGRCSELLARVADRLVVEHLTRPRDLHAEVAVLGEAVRPAPAQSARASAALAGQPHVDRLRFSDTMVSILERNAPVAHLDNAGTRAVSYVVRKRFSVRNIGRDE